jgi:hypothetical protein
MRSLARRRPFDDAPVKQRRERGVEEGALFGHRLGAQHVGGINAMPAGHAMCRADEPAEEAMLVEIARKQADAHAPVPFALFPIGAARRIQIWRDETVIGSDIGLVIRLAKEAVEAFITRQVFRR